MQDLQQIISNHHTVLFARTFLALVLLVAGISKLSNLRSFTDVVRAYDLLPRWAVKIVSRLLPLAEVLVAAGLLLGLSANWPVAAALALFILFGSAVAINLLRGRSDISCGCFGPNQDRKLTWSLVMRNAALAAICVAALAPPAMAEMVLRLPLAEVLTTCFTAGAALALWWLQSLIVAMWRLRLPIESYSVSNRTQKRQKLFSLARAERR